MLFFKQVSGKDEAKEPDSDTVAQNSGSKEITQNVAAFEVATSVPRSGANKLRERKRKQTPKSTESVGSPASRNQVCFIFVSNFIK